MENVIQMNAAEPAPSRLDQLANTLENLKAAETKIKAQRLDVEAEIATIVGVKEEGTTKCLTQFYKVSTVGKLTRNLDIDALNSVRDQIPPAIYDKLIRVKPTIDLKELRYVENNEPEIYQTLASAITTKPAKTAIKVELLEGE